MEEPPNPGNHVFVAPADITRLFEAKFGPDWERIVLMLVTPYFFGLFLAASRGDSWLLRVVD